MKTLTTNRRAIGGAILLIAASSLLLVGYENKKMHTRINSRIARAALSRFDKAAPTVTKFTTWDFDLNGADITGPAVTNPGYIPSTTSEGDVRQSPAEWIEHGGFSADEPEMFMALRHFYDPQKIDKGKTYLTNRGTYWEPLANNAIFNPHIDAKEWALSHADNPYSWEQTKGYFRGALAEPNEEARATLFAKAYRGLGETLHLLADMGCPVHVRNDSHAAPCGYQCRMALGNPDPYEEIVTPEQADQLMPETGAKLIPSLQQAFSAATKADGLFLALSRFTNENFFTADTIAGLVEGNEIPPLIADRPAYASPRLEALEYSLMDDTYYKTFEGGQRVKMCKDATYFGGLFGKNYPYIDKACVASQAAILLPQIAEAGAQLFRLFFPDLQIMLDPVMVSAAAATGRITHTLDTEYPQPLSYRGKVSIWVNLKQQGEKIEVDSEGGFIFQNLSLKEGDRVYALIELPGLSIRSVEVAATAGKGCGAGIADGDVCLENICYVCNAETQELVKTMDCSPPEEQGCYIDPKYGCLCGGS